MKIKMTLLSDTIFGNGMSVPGAEDISVLTDEYGFPYFKGGTFKGIFREELRRLLEFQGKTNAEIQSDVQDLLGVKEQATADDPVPGSRKLVFSDLTLSQKVRDTIRTELGSENAKTILDIFTNVRTFTKIGEKGIVEDGTLRMARCVNKGLIFYSEIKCAKQDEELIEEVLGMMKYIGTLRNRGFGNVKISVVKEA